MAAQRYRSRPSWADQAAAELAEAELAGDGAYQGSWTFMSSSGQEMGPYIKSELISLHERYRPRCTAERSQAALLSGVNHPRSLRIAEHSLIM